MGYKFKVMPSEFDEKSIRTKDPEQLTILLANAKADLLSKQIKQPTILVTTDQVVCQNGKIIEKPKNELEAIKFFRCYSNSSAKNITAVVVTNTKSGKRFQSVDVTKIWFNTITEKKIQELIKDKKYLLLAGGFTVDDPVFKSCIKKIEGTVESILGLPKDVTADLINQAVQSK